MLGNLKCKTKQILSFLLSFVMVISICFCSPIIAYAEESELPLITYSIDNTIDNALLKKIGTFDDAGDSAFYTWQNTGDVYLASLPFGAEITSIQFAKLEWFEAFCDGGCIMSLENALADMIFDEDFTDPNYINDRLDFGYGALYNCVTFDEGFTLPTENVKGFAIYDYDGNYTDTVGTIVFIQISTEQAASDRMIEANGLTIHYTANGDGTSSKIGAFDDAGDTAFYTWQNTGDVYLVSLPSGAEITSIQFAKLEWFEAFCDGGCIMSLENALADMIFDGDFTDPDYINDRLDFGYGALYNCVTFDEGFTLPTENVKGFAIYDYDGNYIDTVGTIVFIQISTANSTGIDRTALDNEIAKIWNGQEYTNNYYRINDRYNGKLVLQKNTSNPTGGFWYELIKESGPLETAMGNFKDQGKADRALEELQIAIANLIPTTQANTTLLYEALEDRKDLTDDPNDPQFTEASWSNFIRAKSMAQAWMERLFDAEGNALADNVPGNQEELDAATAALTAAENDLLYRSLEETLPLWKMVEDWLRGKTDLSETDYTPESWAVWTAAMEALNEVSGTEVKLHSEYEAYTFAIVNASEAYYALTAPEGNITVHVRVADNYGAAYPEYALANASVATYDGEVVLSGDKTVDGLMSAISYDAAQVTEGMHSYYGPRLMTYINGELAVKIENGHSDFWNWLNVGSTQLHDGDSVVLVRAESPWVYRYTGLDSFSAPYRVIYPFVGLLSIQGEDVLEVEAGAELALSVTKTPGAIGAEKRTAPAVNVSLLLSEVRETREEAAGTQALSNTGAKTGGDGKASTVIYAEGWYRLEAVNVTEQTNARSTDGETITGGDYSNLFGGDYVLVHVVPSSDEAALRTQFRAELDEVYNAHGEDYYGARWAEVQSIYADACEIIDGNDPEKPTIGDAAAAKDDAIAQINAIIEELEAITETLLHAFTWVCDMLPDDPAQMTQLQTPAFTQLTETYGAMTEYQQSLLTGAQLSKYQALLAVFGEDGSALPEAHRYTMRVVVEGDPALYDLGYSEITALENTDGEQYSEDGWKYELLVGADQEILFAPGSNLELRLLPVGYSGGEPEYYVTSVTVEGVPFRVNDRESSNPWRWTYTNPWRFYLQSISFSPDEYSRTIAPYSDITVHLTIRSYDEAKTLDELRAEAKAALEQVYQSYSKSNYSTAQWAELTNAYNSGKTAIDAAETEEAINTAKENAITAMAAVPTMEAQTPSGTVGTLGTVHVIVENTVYDEAPAALRGRFVETDIPLDEGDSMMTVILDALEQNGYSWIGTGGSDRSGKEITYIATISYGDDSLSEFDGAPTAGWMGVLNDWFVNESFASFGTQAESRDYRIVDGDEIRVMFTLAGYGMDLGGTWGNDDTSLKELEYTGGTMAPAFSGGTYDYVLLLDGTGAVSVTPTAANKNYQVKTFLNQKLTARNVDYYRRGEEIPVQAGDVIYIGCGERNWLSMNNQEAQSISYSGTWYSITVVDASSTDAVEALIAKIGNLTYSNYSEKAALVSAARSAYDNLSASAKAAVSNYETLTAAEKKIESFKAIDDVKALLAALPKSSNLSDEQVVAARAQIEAADAAYKALTDEQKGYITVGDVANYNELVKRLTKLTPDTTAETITGSTATGDEVTVSAEEIKEAADENGSLAVETENGTVKLDAATLDKLAETGKDVVVSVTENEDGTATVDVTVDGKTVDAKVKVELPAAGEGQVLVIVNADGTEEIVKKSLVEDGTVYAELPAGATVKVIDNAMHFIDVADNAWYADEVEFASSHGLFQGVGNNKFAPAAPMTRAMLATVLYRLEDAAATGANPFADVADGTWYTEAVIWASAEGIVQGTGKGFEPNENITREQIATMLYRYAKTIGLDVSGSAALDKFSDGDKTSSWAKDAMQWAVSVGLFQGDDVGTLRPQGDATRAEVAALLMRMVKLIVK